MPASPMYMQYICVCACAPVDDCRPVIPKMRTISAAIPAGTVQYRARDWPDRRLRRSLCIFIIRALARSCKKAGVYACIPILPQRIVSTVSPDLILFCPCYIPGSAFFFGKKGKKSFLETALLPLMIFQRPERQRSLAIGESSSPNIYNAPKRDEGGIKNAYICSIYMRVSALSLRARVCASMTPMIVNEAGEPAPWPTVQRGEKRAGCPFASESIPKLNARGPGDRNFQRVCVCVRAREQFWNAKLHYGRGRLRRAVFLFPF